MVKVHRGGRWAGAVAAGIGAVLALTPASALAASYHSPGYKGTHRVPKVAPTPPPPPVVLGTGSLPHVLVDAAGTGHIGWTQGGITTESVLHYCRLPRGQKSCAVSTSMIPPDNDTGYGNGPLTDIDFQGPIPLAVGNQLLLLDHRCCNRVTAPDGNGHSDINFLYTSQDGGTSFPGAPGIVGTQEPSGNALIFGGNNPQLGIISDTQTGGTFFQGTLAGTFTSVTANLGNLAPNEAYDGRLALDGTRPVAAFDDLSNQITVREYNGSGDVNNPASWSISQLAGNEPRIAGGPSGVWLAYRPAPSSQWVVRRVNGGVPSGSSVPITSPSQDTGYFTLAESAGGELIAGWIDHTASPAEVHIRTSLDGVNWGPEQVLAKGPIQRHLALSAAADGGGYAMFEVASSGFGEGQVAVAPFGTRQANGQKGLGNVNGQGQGGLGGDQFGTATCTDVHFRSIDVLAQAGCFLRDPAHPNSGAAVAAGPVRINGLDVIPDAGVKVIIDPRLHTINTTGNVTVNLHAPVVGDITLWHGELHVSLRGGLADSGQTLFNFDTSQFAAALKGFPIDAKIDVQLAHDAVVIPISLKLPSYMGGISGQATLRADNANGLQLTSLQIGVDDLVLGALEVKNLLIKYTAQGDVWMGSARLNIPAGSPYFGIDVSVEFDHGDFTMGSFHIDLPWPGPAIFTDAYLAGFGGGFDIHPPKKKFFGSVTVGGIAADPPNYVFTVTGTVSITFIDNGPVILEVDGAGAVHGFQIATAKLIFQTNGYFAVDGAVDINLSVAELKASLSAFVDLPAKEFSSEVKGELLLGSYDVAGADAVISSAGAAVCGSVLGAHLGFGYRWGGSVDVIGPGLGSCDLSPYIVQPVSNRSADRRAHGAAAGIPVSGGTMFEDIAVTGASGPPSVVLTSPSGQQITPAALTVAGAAASEFAVAANNTTYVMLPHPAAGNWTVSSAPGSTPITAVSSARGFAPPVVKAHVSGRRSTRRLSYQVPVRPGLSVQFAEQGTSVYHLLGTATRKRGKLRFRPADGPAGRRTILAIVSENGIPRQRLTVASYVAPSPPTPGRVQRLRVSVRGHRFRVSFGTAPDASRYRVTIAGTDGRHLVRLLGGRGHKFSLPALGYEDRLTVSVVGISKLGRRGHTKRASATWVSKVQLCASLSRKQRRRHHC